MRRWALMLVLWVGIVHPAVMQSDEGVPAGCAFDTAAIIATLEAAQATYNDDAAGAIGALRDAQLQLSELIFACNPAPVLDGEHTTEDLNYTFRYPETWIVDVTYSNTLAGRINFAQMANTLGAIEGGNFSTPIMENGERVIGVILSSTDALIFSSGGIEPPNRSPVEMAHLYERTLSTDSDYVFDEAETLTLVNGRSAARMVFRGETFTSLIYTVALDEDLAHYAVIIAITAPDELAQLEPTVLAVVENVALLAD